MKPREKHSRDKITFDFGEEGSTVLYYDEMIPVIANPVMIRNTNNSLYECNIYNAFLKSMSATSKVSFNARCKRKMKLEMPKKVEGH